jgi:hypothetical protein
LPGDFFLSQDKISRNFPFSMIEWCVLLCVLESGGKESKSISEYSKAERDLIVFPKVKGTHFYSLRESQTKEVYSSEAASKSF